LVTLRKDLPAAEVEALHERLNRALDGVGVDTQPKVAQRLVELSQNPDAQIKDYHEAIRTDAAMTGRVLRLANSAFYAQRQPVTRLERALVILGVERTKAISLGFFLSRAAAAAGARSISRKVWGESVYRASLASAMARSICPHLAPEAFIVGLMLDCGQPLMSRLIGPEYDDLHDEHRNPARLHAAEFACLEFTHTDVVNALMRRWKMPDVLARPIISHHLQPAVGKSTDACDLLHRLAYYVGAVQLEEVGGENRPLGRAPMSTIAERLFEVLPTQVESVVRATAQSYHDTITVFSDVGDAIKDVDALSDRVQGQLVEIMDQQMQRTVRSETAAGPEHVKVGPQTIEVEPSRAGEVVAYINATDGQRMISCTLAPDHETPESVGHLLGLDGAAPADLANLMQVMRRIAA
jgi:HD-like signal output (HDOD) protein